MKSDKVAFFVSAFAAIGLAAFAQGSGYSLTVLNTSPFGSAAYGSDDGVQVGVAMAPPFPGFGNSHALLWHGTPGSVVDLHPAGYSDSIAVGARGNQQIGYAYQGEPHAILWTGTAASAVDLQPLSGYQDSFGDATDGVQQVGEGYVSGMLLRAMLWTGSAASFVDLTPSGLYAAAKGVDQGVQVGYASTQPNIYPQHAYKWAGTAASATDINPSGYYFSQADSIRNGMIGGYGGFTDGMPHGLIWNSGGGFTDLHSTMDWEYVWGVNGVQQAGQGYLNNVEHALVWSGTAASQVDLNAYASGFAGAGASSVDSHGVVSGWVDYGNFRLAAIWTPVVPEPSTLFAMGCGLAALLKKRYAKR